VKRGKSHHGRGSGGRLAELFSGHATKEETHELAILVRAKSRVIRILSLVKGEIHKKLFPLLAATAALSLLPAVSQPSGPIINFAYIVNCESSSISAFAVDRSTGALTPIAFDNAWIKSSSERRTLYAHIAL